MGTTKYIKHKLTAEEVTVIKHALSAYKTKELEKSRIEMMKKLENKDYFICMYVSARMRSTRSERSCSAAKVKDMASSSEQSSFSFSSKG